MLLYLYGQGATTPLSQVLRPLSQVLQLLSQVGVPIPLSHSFFMDTVRCYEIVTVASGYGLDGSF